jgi:NAD(P)H-dependent FMN reductase
LKPSDSVVLTILGIPGSLRRGSYNTALLNAATGLTPEDCRIEVGCINDIPLYNWDVEVQRIPEVVARLKDRIAAADGLLLVTPEYNNSVPGVLKNAIDWLSRPPDDILRVFGGRPVGIIGASTSSFGTILSQAAWLPVLRTLGMRPWFGGRLYVSNAAQMFDESGKLVDPVTRQRLQDYLADFVQFVRRAR